MVVFYHGGRSLGSVDTHDHVCSAPCTIARQHHMVHGYVDFALVVPAAAEAAGRGLAALKQALHA
ncbi:hypothetical protein I545_1546 [Mycobacterium kansasii 662]|uniref:Uncharacterized protein n=2 Tax=Mycobacterium kansasii TaxID=1768 RepID=A0A1V3WHW3_MYCKA|nr:hypothetical protein I547_5022 [Mycobacterium kansasii 824]EUA22149.1 hypothetical protein I545_1546 [Mycobacterium kansasii 662]KEP42423.1 hypothetical protein MKSMC1_24280 [Mycobacterium kansasii]OOK66026.1 hypothetical protein BZL29_7407 [Mycobacterium kansasii]VAZ60188.1 Carboxylesterase NlhH [Mycobacterium kansasii]